MAEKGSYYAVVLTNCVFGKHRNCILANRDTVQFGVKFRRFGGTSYVHDIVVWPVSDVLSLETSTTTV